MKLKVRSWLLHGPTGSQLDRCSRFPWDMLRYDPAYVHDETIASLLSHSEQGGDRSEFLTLGSGADSYVVLLTALPGYTTRIMDPTLGRWASFGWSNFERLSTADERDLLTDHFDARHWNTVIGFAKDSSPVFLTLQDFLDCKNMDKWSEKVRRQKLDYQCERL